MKKFCSNRLCQSSRRCKSVACGERKKETEETVKQEESGARAYRSERASCGDEAISRMKPIGKQSVMGKMFPIYSSREVPLFAANDVAEWIGYRKDKVGRLLHSLSDDEKTVQPVWRAGQMRHMWLVTLDGLYEMVMQSRKRKARELKTGIKQALHQAVKTEEIKEKVEHIERLMLENGILRVNVNPRYIFERLNIRYRLATGDERSRGLHEAIGDYFGFTVPYSRDIPVTLREWLIERCGIEELQAFVAGIENGTIVRSARGHWVNLNGFGSNNVEWNKVLKEFGGCAYCGRTDVQLIPEHIIPQYYLAQSSPESVDLIGNIIPSCGLCNCTKGRMNVEDFFEKQSLPAWRLEKIHKHQNDYRVE